MKLIGLQKMTVLDFPGRVACIVFTFGCNFRCPFCHNASLVMGDGNSDITEEDFFAYLKKRQGILDGVVVTGGEPLLQKGIEDFLRKIKSLGYEIKLDTNGTFPEKLKSIVKEGIVDYVAMDIKNAPEYYGITSGKEDIDIAKIKESVDFLINQEKVEYEFRTTVVAQFHSESMMDEIGEFIKGAKNYYLQGFVDSGDLIGSNMSALPKANMEKMADIVGKYVENVSLRGVN
ncbi:MAG: anaerobic ribonucleoside-triphosphate reductase activating protein [Ruminococcaceae bacterium]|nr:anaerobic ribonucleoside-triphosphate reductase activating protein [Oscillospiraceae bacterium]